MILYRRTKGEKVYLGDSVYARFNEYDQLELTTENGMPNDPSNKIVLESEVLKALEDFVMREPLTGEELT